MAAVMLETAQRFNNPMALPIMDLTLEKDILLEIMGVAAEAREGFHFKDMPSDALCARVTKDVDLSLIHI